MFCDGWGGGGKEGNVIRTTLEKREAIQKRLRVVSSSQCLKRSCRLTAPPDVCGFPWPARQKPTDVGQSLGLPEQLGVVNAEHQDRSIVSRIVIQTYPLCNG